MPGCAQHLKTHTTCFQFSFRGEHNRTYPIRLLYKIYATHMVGMSMGDEQRNGDKFF